MPKVAIIVRITRNGRFVLFVRSSAKLRRLTFFLGRQINVCQTCGSFGMHTACSDELVNELDDSDFECPDCKELSRRKFESINRNEPEITMEEPEMKINEPMIAICEPPDDSQRSAPIESKSRTIELIELSSDEEEEEDGIICMNVCRQLASSNLGLPKSNGHLGKMSNC